MDESSKINMNEENIVKATELQLNDEQIKQIIDYSKIITTLLTNPSQLTNIEKVLIKSRITLFGQIV